MARTQSGPPGDAGHHTTVARRMQLSPCTSVHFWLLPSSATLLWPYSCAAEHIMARTFKLGPALVRAPDSTAQLPDTWLTDLLSKHLDRNDRLAVAQTCKAGLNLLLDEWEDARLTITVRPSSDESPAALLRRMRSAKEQLKRGNRGDTALWFEQGEKEVGKDDTWWQVALSCLTGACDTIPACDIQLQHIPQQLLSLAGQALPALRALQLGAPGNKGFSAHLPPPTHLPSLRELILMRAAAGTRTSLWASVAPYLPQLTSLTIAEQPASARDPATQRPALSSIFSLTHPTTTLAELSLPVQFTTWLAALLQKAAPALNELRVLGISAEATGAADVAPVCSWRTLCITQYPTFPASVWEWLPVPKQGGRLQLDCTSAARHTTSPAVVIVCLPADDKVVEKLSQVDVKGFRQCYVDAPAIQASEQAAVLRAALPAIKPLQSPTTALVLRGFTMSPELAAALSQVAAGPWGEHRRLSLKSLTWPADAAAVTTPLPAFDFLDLRQVLDNGAVAQLVQGHAQANTLYVQDVRMTSPLPEGAASLFRAIVVDGPTKLLDLVRQAELVGQETEWRLGQAEYKITVNTLALEEHTSLIKKLKALNLTRCTRLTIAVDKAMDGTQHGRALQEALAVASALPCATSRITLDRFCACDEVVLQLRNLPQCKALCLKFRSYSARVSGGVPAAWPLARAPWLIPTGPTSWSVSSAHLKPAELEAFITNLPANRTVGEPLAVTVVGKDAQWAQAVNARFEKAGSYPHVAVLAA